MPGLLANCIPKARLTPADAPLKQLRARKTKVGIDRLRTARIIAKAAFKKGAASIAAGASEVDVASAFRRPLGAGLVDFPGVQRSDGFAGCISGANAALAPGADACSRAKKIQRGDLVLIYCNSYEDGYWTDITRTFCGPPNNRQAGFFNAVFEARQAALDTIRPGIPAASVGGAVREAMSERGLGSAFPHGTGHGVGFDATDAHALPLQPGMVFNLEPAIYFKDCGGTRHCDIVAVTAAGCELLTPFQCERADLLSGA